MCKECFGSASVKSRGGVIVNNRYNSRRYDSLRTVRVSVQVTEKEREKLECLARKEGMSISSYIRKIAIYDRWREFFNEY